MPSRKEIYSIIAMMSLLCAPTLVGVFIAGDYGTGLGDALLYWLAGIGYFMVGLTVFKRKTFFYLAILTFVPSGIEVVHMVLNKATISLLFLYTCVIAEPGELLELFTTYWWVQLTALLLWGTYLYLLHRNIQNEYLIPNVRLRWGIVGVWILFYLLTWTTSPVVHAGPRRFVNQSVRLTQLYRTIKSNDAELQSFSFGVTSQSDTDDIVVFLVGETSRYDHWQVNGYERATSPRLYARRSQMVTFDSCYSVSNLTAVSVPMMLSRATPDDVQRLYHEKSLVEAFAEAGWRTAWIADQSFTNHQLLRISSTCDDRYYFDDEDKLHRSYMDSVLLHPLSSELKHTGKAQMIVIHSLGCHYKYTSRYPKSFGVFKPDLRERDRRSLLESLNTDSLRLKHLDKNVRAEMRQMLVNSYDNAILYTDWFINEIICRLEQTGRRALLVYVGDHGENLLDDERNMQLHGSFYGSLYEYHVPLFVWISDAYKEAYPDMKPILESNRQKCISSMVLFQSLLDAGHIECTERDTAMSVFSRQCGIMRPVVVLDANLERKQLDSY